MQNENRFIRDLTALVRDYSAQRARNFYERRQRWKLQKKANVSSEQFHHLQKIKKLEREIADLRRDDEDIDSWIALDDSGFSDHNFEEQRVDPDYLDQFLPEPGYGDYRPSNALIVYGSDISPGFLTPYNKSQVLKIKAKFQQFDLHTYSIVEINIERQALKSLYNSLKFKNTKKFFSIFKSAINKQIKKEAVSDSGKQVEIFEMSPYEKMVRMAHIKNDRTNIKLPTREQFDAASTSYRSLNNYDFHVESGIGEFDSLNQISNDELFVDGRDDDDPDDDNVSLTSIIIDPDMDYASD